MPTARSTVYVIDDDESVRRAFERLLRSADLTVETFDSAEEFLRGERQGENACIVTDIRMRGLTGFDLQQKMQSQGMQMPVIAISASDDSQTRELAKRLGAAAFFRKPIDGQALLDAIWWAISEARNKI